MIHITDGSIKENDLYFRYVKLYATQSQNLYASY